MSPRSRKMIRSRKESPDELFVHKFIVEVMVDKLGDFAVFFLANPMTQRSLIFRKLHWSGPDIEDIPDEVLKEMEEHGADPEEYLMEEQELTHIYEFTSGAALMLHDSDDLDDYSGDPDDEDGGSGPVKVARNRNVDIVESDENKEEDEDDAFVVPTNKTVH